MDSVLYKVKANKVWLEKVYFLKLCIWLYKSAKLVLMTKRYTGVGMHPTIYMAMPSGKKQRRRGCLNKCFTDCISIYRIYLHHQFYIT